MKKSVGGMSRRALLRNAGIGSVALLTLPALATPALADEGQTTFHYVALSQAATVAGVAHRFFMAGDGQITPSRVKGGGLFLHWDNAPAGVPKPLLASGTWKAKRLISFTLAGTYGVQGAGILEMEVDLFKTFPSQAVIPATVEVVCNSGAGGISTGKPEGFMLTIPGTIFVPGGLAGPFVPMTPPLGVTTFGVLTEHAEGD